MSAVDGQGAGRRQGGARACPERTCAVTRAHGSSDDLVRFVVGPDGMIVPDVARRLPGRGVWVACDREIVATAARTNAFQRSLKRPVKVPDGLAELVDSLLAKRALEGLSLANKAGLVVAGFTKVGEAITRSGLAALVHARDAAEDGCGKLDRKFRARAGKQGGAEAPPIIAEFSSVELSLAMGRLNVVHAGVAEGGAARNFLNAVERLRRYRSRARQTAASPLPSGSKTETV